MKGLGSLCSETVYRRVLVLMTPGRHGTDALLAGREIVEAGAGWLTLAVPLPRFLSPFGCGFGSPSHFVVHPEDCERIAERELQALLAGLPELRTNGLIVRPPFASELLRRVAAADHDLLMLPGGLRNVSLRAQLAVRSPVPVISPRGPMTARRRPAVSMS